MKYINVHKYTKAKCSNKQQVAFRIFYMFIIICLPSPQLIRLPLYLKKGILVIIQKILSFHLLIHQTREVKIYFRSIHFSFPPTKHLQQKINFLSFFQSSPFLTSLHLFIIFFFFKEKKDIVSVCNLNWSDQVINTMETKENLLPFRLAEGASISIIRPTIQYIFIPLLLKTKC